MTDNPATFQPLPLFRACNALLRPRSLFAALSNGSYLGSALLLLVLLGFCSGITGMHAALSGQSSYGQDWWREMSVSKAVTISIWNSLTNVFWATVLTWFLARMARENLRFDALYSVIAFAALPLFLTVLAFPLRNVSLLSLHIWQACHILVVVWVGVLVCVGVQACMRQSFSKAAQSCLPVLWMLASLACRAHVASPTSFRAACAWQIAEGRYVRVYYPPGKPSAQVDAITRGMDRTVEKDCAVLKVKPLDFKISVFCFADDALQRKLAGEEEEPDNTAHTFWDCITIAYDTWDNLDGQMAHELCHILIANRLTDKVHGLADEGLCEYVAREAAPEEGMSESKEADNQEAEKEKQEGQVITPIPLRTLARSDVFFDWEQARDTDASGWAHYTTAESFVTYLIKRQGMAKFKTFYQRLGQHAKTKGHEDEQGEALALAVQEAYRIPLSQLEAQWRAAASRSGHSTPASNAAPPAAFSHTDKP